MVKFHTDLVQGMSSHRTVADAVVQQVILSRCVDRGTVWKYAIVGDDLWARMNTYKQANRLFNTCEFVPFMEGTHILRCLCRLVIRIFKHTK